jgi:hypothetical protein
LTAIDDFVAWVQSQAEAAEQWAKANPLGASVLLVIVSGVVIVAGSKAADILLGR